MTDQEFIRSVREKLSLTQTQLAERLGVTLRTVQIWEKEGLPDKRTRLALERLLELGG